MRSNIHTSDALTVAAGFALGVAVTWIACAARERLDAPGLSDDILARRVRARVGEIVSQPHGVTVQVEHGVVRVSGQAPPRECETLLASLVHMPGVLRLRNALSARNPADPG